VTVIVEPSGRWIVSGKPEPLYVVIAPFGIFSDVNVLSI
jgi:hypothetical protein